MLEVLGSFSKLISLYTSYVLFPKKHHHLRLNTRKNTCKKRYRFFSISVHYWQTFLKDLPVWHWQTCKIQFFHLQVNFIINLWFIYCFCCSNTGNNLSQQISPVTGCRFISSSRRQNRNVMIAMVQSLYQYRVVYIVRISF